MSTDFATRVSDIHYLTGTRVLVTVNLISGYYCRAANQYVSKSRSSHQPVMRAPTFGDRAFVSAAPSLWNWLPVSVRKIETLTSFKKELKTFLFKTAYK